MTKYRKKIEIIEALLCNDNFEDIKAFCGDDSQFIHGTVLITTSQGIALPINGDYIVKRARGDFYVSTPELFKEEYDEVEDPYSYQFSPADSKAFIDTISNETKAILASPYGRYVSQYAKNHGITMTEAYEKPMCKAALKNYHESGRLGG